LLQQKLHAAVRWKSTSHMTAGALANHKVIATTAIGEGSKVKPIADDLAGEWDMLYDLAAVLAPWEQGINQTQRVVSGQVFCVPFALANLVESLTNPEYHFSVPSRQQKTVPGDND
jgi:hypothetical protein